MLEETTSDTAEDPPALVVDPGEPAAATQPDQPDFPAGEPSVPAVLLCTRCGVANQPWERFCRSCSAFLEWSGKPVEGSAAAKAPVPEDVLDLGPTRLVEKVWDWTVFGARHPSAPPPPPVAPGLEEVDWSRGTAEVEEKPYEEQPGVVRPDQETGLTPIIGARRPVVESDEADVGCRACGAGNSGSRHFCRRCGASLLVVAPPARQSRWQRRLTRRHERQEAKRELNLGSRPRRKRQALGGIGGGWITSVVSKIFLGVAILAVLAGTVGPYSKPIRNRVSAWYHSVTETIDPQYVPINAVGATATSSLPGHPAIDVIDGNTNTYWAASGPAVGSGLDVKFGQSETISRVGFLIGVPGANYLNQPRPQLLHLTFSDGVTDNLSLVDSASLQTFKVDAPKTTEVQMLIDSIFQSAVGQNVAIDEVEFWTKK